MDVVYDFLIFGAAALVAVILLIRSIGGYGEDSLLESSLRGVIGIAILAYLCRKLIEIWRTAKEGWFQLYALSLIASGWPFSLIIARNPPIGAKNYAPWWCVGVVMSIGSFALLAIAFCAVSNRFLRDVRYIFLALCR